MRGNDQQHVRRASAYLCLIPCLFLLGCGQQCIDTEKAMAAANASPQLIECQGSARQSKLESEQRVHLKRDCAPSPQPTICQRDIETQSLSETERRRQLSECVINSPSSMLKQGRTESQPWQWRGTRDDAIGAVLGFSILFAGLIWTAHVTVRSKYNGWSGFFASRRFKTSISIIAVGGGILCVSRIISPLWAYYTCQELPTWQFLVTVAGWYAVAHGAFILITNKSVSTLGFSCPNCGISIPGDQLPDFGRTMKCPGCRRMVVRRKW